MNYFHINKDELFRASETLFISFKEDGLMRWLFGSEQAYMTHGQSVIEGWVKYCVLYGMAIRTKDFESVALRRWPGDIEFNWWRIFRSGMYKLPKHLGKDGMKRLMQLDELLLDCKKKHLKNKPFLYCWMLGTKPDKQNQGFGNILMQATFEKAKQLDCPCYLEVQSPQSKLIHEHKGYQALETVGLPNGKNTITAMIKPMENHDD